MQFSLTNTCLMAIAGASAVFAQTDGFNIVSQPQTGDVLTAGKPYTIKWTPGGASGPVSIVLLQGNTNTTLEIGNTIGSSIDGSAGQYVWDPVPSALDYPLYGLKIELDSDHSTFQYSSYFTIDGVASSSGSASASASASVSAPTSAPALLAVSSSAASPSASETGSNAAPSSSVQASITAAAPVSTSASSFATYSTGYQNSTLARMTATATGSSNATGTSAPAHTGAAASTIASGASLLGALLLSIALLA